MIVLVNSDVVELMMASVITKMELAHLHVNLTVNSDVAQIWKVAKLP